MHFQGFWNQQNDQILSFLWEEVVQVGVQLVYLLFHYLICWVFLIQLYIINRPISVLADKFETKVLLG